MRSPSSVPRSPGSARSGGGSASRRGCQKSEWVSLPLTMTESPCIGGTGIAGAAKRPATHAQRTGCRCRRGRRGTGDDQAKPRAVRVALPRPRTDDRHDRSHVADLVCDVPTVGEAVQPRAADDGRMAWAGKGTADRSQARGQPLQSDRRRPGVGRSDTGADCRACSLLPGTTHHGWAYVLRVH